MTQKIYKFFIRSKFLRDGPEDMDEPAVRAFLREKVGQEKENHYFSVIKYVDQLKTTTMLEFYFGFKI